MPDFDDLAMSDDPDDESFVDQKALQEVIERAVDALRPIGLTVIPEAVQAAVDPMSGEMMLMLGCQLRPKAARKVVEDREAAVEFNQMMAKRNEDMIADKEKAIAELIASGDVEAMLGEGDLGSECAHEKRHPSTGHCLNCGEGLE